MKLGNTFSALAAWAAVATILGGAATGCLARPVGQQPPTTKVNFTQTVSQQAVDKVDLLFAIDNSASMGDKQAILKDAVPNLIQGLLTPPCVNRETRLPVASGQKADPAGNKDDNYGCTDPTSEPDFKPVGDMHIGIVSSSVALVVDNKFGNICGNTDPKNPRRNDGAKLVNINGRPQGADGPKNPLAPLDFLAWYPQSKENEDKKRHPVPQGGGFQLIGDANKPDEGGLTPNFQNLVIGVGQNGCGLEAQLESVYRFLVQPDPVDIIRLDAFDQADMGEGVDLDILKQRADFLRPDSLVAIIMLTDEDDSSSDPLSVSGFGYAFMARDFPGSNVPRGQSAQGKTAPRGTSACDKDPASKECTSCGFASTCDQNSPDCARIKLDPNCTQSPVAGQQGIGYDGYYAPTDDDINVRFHRMKERYGVDPQYPIERYTDGFTKARIPDRSAEHTIKEGANGQRLISDYVVPSVGKCTNPLFAAKLPTQAGDEICLLPRGGRNADLIFFAVVGGVPNELLHFDASGTPEAAEKSRITDEDWVKILGKNPKNYDYEGIDPHMVQSVSPRENLLSAGSPTSGRGENGSDKIHGREWNTQKKDLQYACTFKLPQERSCATNSEECDSSCTDENGAPVGNAPLCGQNAVQVKAKAYPTIREFQVVRALRDQGVVASLCPIQLDNPEAADYGYKPAVAAIIDRLKNALTAACLPQKLRTDEQSANPDTVTEVPCLVLAQLSKESGQTCASLELGVPDPEILRIFKEQQKAESGDTSKEGSVDLSELEVCQLKQKVVRPGETCASDPSLEWCYFQKTPGSKDKGCAQRIVFAAGTSTLAGARFSLQCINQFAAGEAAGEGTGSSSSTSGAAQTQSRKH